jgi:hypothetical protein
MDGSAERFRNSNSEYQNPKQGFEGKADIEEGRVEEREGVYGGRSRKAPPRDGSRKVLARGGGVNGRPARKRRLNVKLLAGRSLKKKGLGVRSPMDGGEKLKG